MDYIYKEGTTGNLPHLQPPDATFFVTFRLAGSVPQSVLRFYTAQKEWLERQTSRPTMQDPQPPTPDIDTRTERLRQVRRELFSRIESILDRAADGPTWLKQREVAQVVKEALHYRDGRVYRLDAYCIMSNHVHAVFSPFLSAAELREIHDREGLQIVSQNPPLSAIMQSLKGYTARSVNRLLNRSGAFWAKESYDHVVRNAEELNRVVRYTLANPVKAGLVRDWREWEWSYLSKVLQTVQSAVVVRNRAATLDAQDQDMSVGPTGADPRITSNGFDRGRKAD
jgi:putative transposase